MNRFTFLTSASRRLALAAAVLGFALPVLAQQAPVRPFPPKAERGAMVITNPPDLVLNGKPARLSPGARIRSVDNMMVMSGALVGQNLLVNYVLESNGLVHEVWILTEAEAKLVRPTGGITLVK